MAINTPITRNLLIKYFHAPLTSIACEKNLLIQQMDLEQSVQNFF